MTASADLRRHRRHWTRPEYMTALSLLERHPLHEVAQRLNRTVGAVRAYLKQQGLRCRNGLITIGRFAREHGWSWSTARDGAERLQRQTSRFGIRDRYGRKTIWWLHPEEAERLSRFLAETVPQRRSAGRQHWANLGEWRRQQLLTAPSRTEFRPGEVIGNRTLIKFLLHRGRRAAWEVRCRCGRRGIVAVTMLRNGAGWCRSCASSRARAREAGTLTAAVPLPRRCWSWEDLAQNIQRRAGLRRRPRLAGTIAGGRVTVVLDRDGTQHTDQFQVSWHLYLDILRWGAAQMEPS